MSAHYQEVHLADYRPPSHLVPHIKLEFDIVDENNVDVVSSMTFEKNPHPEAASGDGGLTLHGSASHLTLVSVAINGKQLTPDEYELQKDGNLRIHQTPDAFTLTVNNRINPKDNTACMGLYVSDGVFCTQCESEGFRNITFALDRPDVYSQYEVRITADAERYPTLIANGAPGAAVLVDGRRSLTWLDERPKPPHLFAMAVGNFDELQDTFTYPSGREIDLRYFVSPGEGPKARWALNSLKDALQHEYDRWGHEYYSPSNLFMTLAVDAFVFGAMENTGLNIFNASLVLASSDTATDDRHVRIDSVVNHEFAHDETGNRRVPNNWFQISYKEGLTVFRDQTYTEDKYGYDVKRIEDVAALRSGVFAYDSSPLTHPMVLNSYLKTDNNYDVITYPKGAEMNRMVQTLVGKDAFRAAYRAYHDVEDTSPATISNWLDYIAEHTDADLRQFSDTWLGQAGVPTLKVSAKYDEAVQTYALTIAQALPVTPDNPEQKKQPFHMPFVIGLIGPDGKDLSLTPADESFSVREDGMIELRKLEQTFVFKDISEAPVPSLNRNFSAYARVEFELERDQLAFLAANDSNAVNRWDAVQQLGAQIYQDAIEALTSGKPVELDHKLAEVFDSILTDDSLDNALKAEMLALPDRGYMTNLQKPGSVDPVLIYQARQALVGQLGDTLNDQFETLYQALQCEDEYQPTPAEIGRRRLMNTCLAYLVNAANTDHSTLAKSQFDRRQNYNDALIAISLLTNTDNQPASEEALGAMYDKYQDDSLVMNEWLGIQARAESTTVTRMRALTQHPVFSYQNPNKVRSLIQGFAMNVPQFHKEDGSGYAFFADQIIKMDGVNAQVASGLAGVFARAPIFVPAVRDRMLEQLQRIKETLGETMSENLYEVVNKTLECS